MPDSQIQLFEAHPALQDVVSNIFTIDAILDPNVVNKIGQYPPTPQHCIILYINAPISAKKVTEKEFTKRSSCVVVGPQLTRMHLMINQNHKAVAIGFHPGGLYRFLGVPMKEIFDEGFDGLDVIGSEIGKLQDMCQHKESMEEINVLVQEYLLSRLPKTKESLPFDEAMKLAIQYNGECSVEKLADFSCLSIRQFERKCHERLGMSPKLYNRIIRFSNAYRLFEKDPSLTWLEIAHRSGYYDQMHFIKDFKEFAGITPSMMKMELSKVPIRLQAEIII